MVVSRMELSKISEAGQLERFVMGCRCLVDLKANHGLYSDFSDEQRRQTVYWTAEPSSRYARWEKPEATPPFW